MLNFSVDFDQSRLSFKAGLLRIIAESHPEFRLIPWSIQAIMNRNQIDDFWDPVFEEKYVIATIKMVRRAEFYVIRYYLPTFLLVLINFVGFWIPVNAWPARVKHLD